MLKIAVSPCPNDTVSFWPLLEKKTSPPFPIQVDFYELNELNSMVLEDLQGIKKCPYDIVKISCALLNKIPSSGSCWKPLSIGGAFSYHNGPKLVSHRNAKKMALEELDLIVPSHLSSAYAIFSHLFPHHPYSQKNTCLPKTPRRLCYSEILRAVQTSPNALGLIIHESHLALDPAIHIIRADLGKMWQQAYQLPIPLGLQLSHTSIPNNLLKSYIKYWKQSTVFALLHLDQAIAFIQKHSQEKSSSVIRTYLEDFVTIDSFHQSTNAQRALNTLTAPSF